MLSPTRSCSRSLQLQWATFVWRYQGISSILKYVELLMLKHFELYLIRAGFQTITVQRLARWERYVSIDFLEGITYIINSKMHHLTTVSWLCLMSMMVHALFDGCRQLPGYQHRPSKPTTDSDILRSSSINVSTVPFCASTWDWYWQRCWHCLKTPSTTAGSTPRSKQNGVRTRAATSAQTLPWTVHDMHPALSSWATSGFSSAKVAAAGGGKIVVRKSGCKWFISTSWATNKMWQVSKNSLTQYLDTAITSNTIGL